MKEYDNYIFDLYGTLIDIYTDERSIKPWRVMSDVYSAYGCDWEPKKLRKAYFDMDAFERAVLRKKHGMEPEIKIERVFIRLMFEVGETHPAEVTFSGRSMSQWRELYAADPEAVIGELMGSDTVWLISNTLRIASRKYIRPYENTLSTLSELKRRGKGVYLLSNAQRIYTWPEIERCSLADAFDGIYISSDKGIMKPEERFMFDLLEEYGLDMERSVMVGNEMKCDVAVALRAGMESIFLNTGHLDEETLAAQLEVYTKGHDYPQKLMPQMVMSGDIKEILNCS